MKAKTHAEFSEMAKKLADSKIKISGKVSSGTHLFKGIRPEDIAQVIERDVNIIVPTSSIKIDRPIKETGTHTVAVVQGTMHAEFRLTIIKE